ncbi:hypothetical protein [Algoriphagus boritolerans]|uniref:Uncharacterized protein n=1 Tax=Algoriphagus boritolerans DSM 17298 = JCM 18970 TaxID=1120964 RepID=A0A1H5WN46_9BACT|nr:hypothetical protein [Algoriphagus boritolerans]SEG00676.1 hypothetical protein SAMN03080598_02164 [Algoriphagus boritolerans DSM 17298 = JCM 18970]
MISPRERREHLYQKIDKVPEEKLGELESLISEFISSSPKKSDPLAFAGIWKESEQELFEELDERLLERRSKSGRVRDE